MIDVIKLYDRITLDTSKIDLRKFNLYKYTYTMFIEEEKVEEERDIYIYNKDFVVIKYFPSSSILSVQGKFLNLSEVKNRVDTSGTLWGGTSNIISKYISTILSDNEMNDRSFDRMNHNGDVVRMLPDREQVEICDEHVEENLESIIERLNKIITDSIGHKVDINNFRVSGIEACFNVETPHVERYIELFNMIFKHKDDKRYKNFIYEQNKPINTSFYVKTKTEYKNNSRRNYVVNFYNKQNQLIHLKKTDKKYKSSVTDSDIKLAKNILRLEVQCYPIAISNLAKKYRKNRTLKDFLDIDLCRNIVVDKYNFFIYDEDLDFYTYKVAKDIITNDPNIDSRIKRGLLQYCYKLSRNNNVSSIKSKYNKILKDEYGIAPFFIPTRFGVDYLESPIKMLDRTVRENKKDKESFKVQENYILPTVMSRFLNLGEEEQESYINEHDGATTVKYRAIKFQNDVVLRVVPKSLLKPLKRAQKGKVVTSK